MNDVTIAVKTFERPDSLREMLPSIRKLYPEVKILIADDSKKPYVEEIVQGDPNMEALILPFDVGLSRGRNELLKKIKTKYFVLCDDDFIFFKESKLERFREILENSDTELIGGGIVEKSESGEYDQPHYYAGNLVMDSERNLRIDFVPTDQGTIPCDIVLNFFMAETDAVLNKVGGWDPRFKIVEHTPFFWNAKKKNLKVAFTPSVMVNHNPARPQRYFTFRKKRLNKYFLLFFKVMNIRSWTGGWGTRYPHDYQSRWYRFVVVQKCIPNRLAQKFKRSS